MVGILMTRIWKSRRTLFCLWNYAGALETRADETAPNADADSRWNAPSKPGA